MMKRFFSVLSIGLLLFMGACQDNDSDIISNQPVDGETTNVEFELDASSLALGANTRAYTPEYTSGGFSIYAFRLTGDDYIFLREINLANMRYDAARELWVATDQLPIGTYKFIHAYGVKPQSGSSITEPSWDGRVLGTSTLIDLNQEANAVPLNEIFLETTKDANALVPYQLGLQEGPNPTVSGTLNRAVSRVDLMFISAIKNADGSYTEVSYTGAGGNILGGRTISNLQFNFTDANNQMNIFGVNTTSSPSDVTVNLTNGTPNWYNFANTIIIGDGERSIVGDVDYYRYDNVEAGDIISGSAHIFGTYMMPTDDATPTAKVTLGINSTAGDIRNINVVTPDPNDDDRIPLERNKVTLIKIYVLDGNHVFSTGVQFEVEIVSVWEDDAHLASGELS